MRVSIAAFAALGLLFLLSHTATLKPSNCPPSSSFPSARQSRCPIMAAHSWGSFAATGRNEFDVPGLAFPGFQNRSIGQDMSASNIWATATIHDFDAMDQAI